MKAKKENVAIIAAGGRGKRLGIKEGKQYLPLLGKPALFYTLQAFEKNKKIHRIIVATTPNNFRLLRAMVEKYHFLKVKNLVKAGKKRFDTVKNALRAVLKNAGLVLIHDGSRLLVSQRLINEVIKVAQKFGAAVPAILPADTIKEVNHRGNVKKTLVRQDLRLIQTPQAFKTSIIKTAYKKITPGKILTDDAAFLEKLGHSVRIVTGDRNNIKLTYPEDINYLEFLIRKNEHRFRV
jgi:2-C-methyl-D-erythritol 4-phosphate cytidylyltransferase